MDQFFILVNDCHALHYWRGQITTYINLYTINIIHTHLWRRTGCWLRAALPPYWSTRDAPYDLRWFLLLVLTMCRLTPLDKSSSEAYTKSWVFGGNSRLIATYFARSIDFYSNTSLIKLILSIKLRNNELLSFIKYKLIRWLRYRFKETHRFVQENEYEDKKNENEMIWTKWLVWQ